VEGKVWFSHYKDGETPLRGGRKSRKGQKSLKIGEKRAKSGLENVDEKRFSAL